jgi:Na+-driven multidrug efflux pump
VLAVVGYYAIAVPLALLFAFYFEMGIIGFWYGFIVA